MRGRMGTPCPGSFLVLVPNQGFGSSGRERPVPGAPGWAGTISGCLTLSSRGIRLCPDPEGTNLLDGWDGKASGEPLTQ